MKISQWAGAAVGVALALGVSVESVARGRYLVTIEGDGGWGGKRVAGSG
jgi:hypothetical protein